MATISKKKQASGETVAARGVAGRGASVRAAKTNRKTVRKAASARGKKATSAAAKIARRKVRSAAAESNGGGSSLVIVESPAKARTISKYLGPGFQVKATVGHVRDLPEKRLGIDIEKGFLPEYVTIEGKEKTLEIGRASCRERV